MLKVEILLQKDWARYLITDEPTKEMKQPIIDTFKRSDGNLTEIQLLQRKWKIQTPENWFIQGKLNLQFYLRMSWAIL